MENAGMKRLNTLVVAGALVGAVAVSAACGSGSSTSTVTVSSAGGGSSSTNSKVLVGAGSTFVAPLVAQWESDYAKSAAAVTITYGAIGSGGGIDAITNRSVDFGASDAPLSSDQATACKGCVQIPWALGATAIDYNLKGAPDHLKLTGPVLADIYLGKVTTWNDRAIAKLNPGVSLPATHITPIYRSDSSGTSFVLTDYLASVSPEWKSKIGTSTQPTFPTGTGAEHSSGVVAAMQATDGGITYAETSYTQADSLQSAMIANAAGKFLSPTNDAVLAAAKAGTTRPDGTVKLVDPPASAATAYPLASYTYIIVPEKSPKASTLQAFIKYAIGPTGQGFGPDLGYPALPANIVSQDQQLIAKIHS
jgi:phosphate transport system substrate-binding protein